jgi:hypothetical protein
MFNNVFEFLPLSTKTVNSPAAQTSLNKGMAAKLTVQRVISGRRFVCGAGGI